MERITVGAVGVVGKVGQCQPPSIVMPLTVEPSKPRLCQDQRYLNCWMRDMPFHLESVGDLTRYVDKNHFQSKLDDKSGYDHVLMDEESRILMGFQWGGWWFVNNVLPFGWKISPYIYQSLGMKLIGKCISFSLVVPAAKLFTREMNIALSIALHSKKLVKIAGPLRMEIEYWRFLDTWEGHMTWREERHLVVSLASDASRFGWGGTLLDHRGHTVTEVGDSWCEPMLSRPIHVKETTALSRTLQALGDQVRNSRVDVLVDSTVLLNCWKRQYSRTHDMLEALKDLFWTTADLNVAISLQYVKSADNPADAPSRRLSPLDCALAPRLWSTVQQMFGGPKGHTCDLMALDSNAQCDHNGDPLPHIAPAPTPKAMGVNVFAHHISWVEGSVFENCYVFPPFQLIGPVLKFLREQKARCTIVVPDRYPRPYWWPILQSQCSSELRLAQQGDVDVLRRPSKDGFVDYGPVPWDLWAFRSLHGVARLWVPAVACPQCSYPNDSLFRFCQQCGYVRRTCFPPPQGEVLEIDVESIDSRIDLLVTKQSTYDRQKSRLFSQLSQFLASLPIPKDLMSATPHDLVRFLVWKDKTGKTQVHPLGCPHRGLKGPFLCGCPLRLAAGSVDSLIGKLRAIFKENDRAGDWEERIGLGNPAASILVKKYCKCIKEEQAAAGITPKQATPLFVDKLARLADHLDNQLETSRRVDPIKTYILARDQAYFKTLFFSGDRPGDLAQVRTNEMLRFPNDDGLLFNHTWGKTLRAGKSNLFGIRRCANTKICPVTGIERYIALTRAMQVDLNEGFLFRPTTGQRTISDTSISSEAMNSRLTTYLKEAGIHEGETAHSFRSGCAITLALSGSALADVMGHVGWERSHTATYYMQLEKVLRHDSTSALLAEAVDEHHPTADLAQLYQDLNSVKDFVLAFPPEKSTEGKPTKRTVPSEEDYAY
ncbi:hypothetical protein QZH41_003888 [Actinostola sp. cb2023]|nr:hypothetical protein QZH41_003888 [Actinostola sp. cb2023]